MIHNPTPFQLFYAGVAITLTVAALICALFGAFASAALIMIFAAIALLATVRSTQPRPRP